MVLEVLDITLVLFGGGASGKSAKIATMAGRWICFARVEPILARL
jgi:hypothetical protein